MSASVVATLGIKKLEPLMRAVARLGGFEQTKESEAK